MSSKWNRTFRETLLEVAQQNAQVLEHKANIAALLARTYPEYQGILRAIETEALDQVFRILADIANSHDPSHRTNGSDHALAGLRLAAD